MGRMMGTCMVECVKAKSTAGNTLKKVWSRRMGIVGMSERE